MVHGTHDDDLRTDAQVRADELRSLAGPVESGAEGTGQAGQAGHSEHTGGDAAEARPDAPDARTDPAVDQVREGGEGDLGDDADPYELRSMPAQPNPTADDPASNLNF